MSHLQDGFTVTGRSPVPLIEAWFRAALRVAFDGKYAGTDPLIRRSRHADLQANVALALANQPFPAPYVAREIVKMLRVGDFVSDVRISALGHINLTLNTEWVAKRLSPISASERLAVPVAATPQRVLLEYSSPDVAEVAHAGHLRTEIVGDAVARILEYLGDQVIREKRAGDRGASSRTAAGARLDCFNADLAAIRHRIEDQRVDRLVYLAGGEQREYLELLFAVARMTGMEPSGAALEHAEIGLVIDPRTGSELKSRSGEAFRASALLAGVRERAAEVFDESGRGALLDAGARAAIIDATADGALRFADLLAARHDRYSFDVDRMIGFTGRTAGFVQYSTARMAAILRKGKRAPEPASDPIIIKTGAERALVLHLLDFGLTLGQAGAASEPHLLARYLYDLAVLSMAFYWACPVLKASEEIKASRLALCAVALRTLVTGLDLLGVPAPDWM